MGLFGDILNGVPVVGHVKAGVHALTGDLDEAGRAFTAATRSTAVVVAGTAGAIVGGPAGAVAGGIAAGTACDAITSAAKGEADGVISGVIDIAEDLSEGRVPVSSVLKTGLLVGADAVGGVTGGSISNIPLKLGKDIVKDTVVIATKTATTSAYTLTAASASREIANHIPPDSEDNNVLVLPVGWNIVNNGGNSGPSSGNKSQSIENTSNTSNNSSSGGNTSKSQKNSTPSSGGSSGSDPPRDGDKRNQKDHEKDDSAQTLSHFDALLKLFKASELGQVIICGVKIFAEITKAQKVRLRELIKRLRNENTFERVIEAVRNIFNKLPSSEITFQNFLHLCEMVATYVSDRLARRMELQSTSSNRPTTPFHVRRAQNLTAVLQEILQPGSRNNILNIFTEIRSRIATAMRRFYPTFGSEISAVYHYFKHKFVPDSTEVLTIEEYLQLVKDSLSRIQQSSYYRQLQNGQARRLVYDRYYERFRRRVRIVFQAVGDDITLSTCHILDDAFEGDYDGFEHYQTTK